MITQLPNRKESSGEPMRILFLGTPDFAVPALQALFHLTQITSDRMQFGFLEFRVVGVVTQPDRPVGREQKLIAPPVKILAEQYQIPVFQPEKLRDPAVIEHIRGLKPDLMVVVAYGQIIPKAILGIPKYGAINVHGSLLPKYRGASPIQAAIAAGEIETGVTIMLMDEQMDHGSILATQRVSIAANETGESLFKKLAPLGAELLVKTILDWMDGTIKPQKQDHAAATYCKLLKRENGKINWQNSAEVIERKIRAYTPWPGTWTMWNGKRFNLLKVYVISNLEELTGTLGEKSNKAGTVIKTKTGFAVQCGSGALEILELQLEGKKPMGAAAFLLGHSEIIGTKLI